VIVLYVNGIDHLTYDFFYRVEGKLITGMWKECCATVPRGLLSKDSSSN